MKAPTCLLLNPNQSFNSFGYEAKDKFADLEEEEARQYFYFDCFKIILHNNEVREKFILFFFFFKYMKLPYLGEILVNL